MLSHYALTTDGAGVCRVTSSMEQPALPRTLSPIWSDIPAYAGNAEQMEKYLSGELTRYFASHSSSMQLQLDSVFAACLHTDCVHTTLMQRPAGLI